jgi:hypothetical protein
VIVWPYPVCGFVVQLMTVAWYWPGVASSISTKSVSIVLPVEFAQKDGHWLPGPVSLPQWSKLARQEVGPGTDIVAWA